MTHYYLHIWSVLDFDYSATEFLNREVHPPLIGAIGLEVDMIPSDAMFQIWPLFFCDDNLKQAIVKSGLKEITFTKVDQLKKGPNLAAIHPDFTLPKHYWRIDFLGIPGKDDIAIYNHSHLVVSEYGLDLLRKGGVLKAESDLISGSIDEYFEQNKHLFWMPEPLRSRYIERFIGKRD